MIQSIKILMVSLFISIASLIVPFTASANHEHVNYSYHVGDDFAGVVHGPDIAMAKNGDTVEIIGSGTLSEDPDSVTGGGTFTHKNKNGTVIGSGTWNAMRLINFRSFGSGVIQGTPPELEGGRAKIRVHLSPSGGGSGFDAVLKLYCKLGDFPSSTEEGIRLYVSHGPKFTEQVSGENVFVRLP